MNVRGCESHNLDGNVVEYESKWYRTSKIITLLQNHQEVSLSLACIEFVAVFCGHDACMDCTCIRPHPTKPDERQQRQKPAAYMYIYCV